VQQLIIAGYRNTTHATDTEYNPLAGGYTWSSLLFDSQQVVSTPGTIKNLMVKLYDPPGAGKSYTFTLMKNGVAQTLSVAISDTNTQGADTTNEVAVSAGDLVTLRCTPSGTPTITYAKYSCVFEGDNANESLILGVGESYSSTFYSPLSGGNSAGTSVDNKKTYQVIPTPGTIKNLYVNLEEDPGTSPEAYRFTLRKNGVNTALTCTITADATTGSNTADEVAVAAGDCVDLMIEPLNSPSADPDVIFGLTFVAATDGESLLLGQSGDVPTLDFTEYKGISSTDWSAHWDSVESNVYQLAQSGFTLKKFYAWVSESLLGDYTLNIRANGGNTGIAITIPSGQQAGSDISNKYELSDYDYLTISCLAVTTAAHVHWGLVASPPSPPAGLENKSAGMAAKMVGAGLI